MVSRESRSGTHTDTHTNTHTQAQTKITHQNHTHSHTETITHAETSPYQNLGRNCLSLTLLGSSGEEPCSAQWACKHLQPLRALWA